MKKIFMLTLLAMISITLVGCGDSGNPTVINQYTVEYVDYEGTILQTADYDFGSDLSGVIAPTDPSREGYTFSGWDITMPSIMGTEKVAVTATYNINQYIISFEENEGIIVDDITQDFNSAVVEPLISRVGYTLAGWFTDTELSLPYTFNRMPSDNMILYAKWELRQYTISYILDGGINNVYNASTYNINTETFPFLEPEKEGHTFLGWFENEDFSADQILFLAQGYLKEIELYAKWEVRLFEAEYYLVDGEYNDVNDILLYFGDTITEVSLGSAHSAALSAAGRVFTWGYNEYGQLGDGTEIQRNSPIEITNSFNLAPEDKVIKIVLGDSRTSAITSTGRVFIWGYNNMGEIGDGTIINKNIPTEITNMFNLLINEKIVQVSLGGTHSSALSSFGRVFMWGNNDYGQLGDGTTTNRTVPAEIKNMFDLPIDEEIIRISLGNNHSSAITSKGRLFIWGSNLTGELSDQLSEYEVLPVDITSIFNLENEDSILHSSLSWAFSSILTQNGQVFTWGYSHLGDGSHTSSGVPINITNYFSLELNEKIIMIYAGGGRGVITSTGRVLMWGANNYRKLGDGTNITRYSPVDISGNFDLYEGEAVIELSLGSFHSGALTSFGRVIMWGRNDIGSLGTSDSPEILEDLEVFKTMSLVYTEQIYFGDQIDGFEVEKIGYNFSQWNEHQVVFEFSTMPANDLALYAWFNLATYSIDFDLDGGNIQIDNPYMYTVESDTIELPNPIKNGFEFIGWYDNSKFTGDPITSLQTGSIGDFILYAKWGIN